MLKVLLVMGTRPEVIKLAPVHSVLRRRPDEFRAITLATGQHRELLDQMLRVFDIRPDMDLDILEPNQSLHHAAGRVITRMEAALTEARPDIVAVQGDTSSAFAAALASYYSRIPVAHVEAGLRSFDKFRPYPEEINRTLISHVADINFCPTRSAAKNLAREGVAPSTIIVTGNTVIDALLQTAERPDAPAYTTADPGIATERMILVTGHRRENFGEGLKRVLQALMELVDAFRDVTIVYSLHPNPNVSGPVRATLGKRERIIIIDPPDYVRFVSLMKKCDSLSPIPEASRKRRRHWASRFWSPET
jgi:UDP-N-acetylglucosamine 2-epimerase (non-hydrolysing)